MNQELAEKVMQLSIEANRIVNEKFVIQKQLGLFGWDDVQAEAMKFLLGAQNANV